MAVINNVFFSPVPFQISRAPSYPVLFCPVSFLTILILSRPVSSRSNESTSGSHSKTTQIQIGISYWFWYHISSRNRFRQDLEGYPVLSRPPAVKKHPVLPFRLQNPFLFCPADLASGPGILPRANNYTLRHDIDQEHNGSRLSITCVFFSQCCSILVGTVL